MSPRRSRWAILARLVHRGILHDPDPAAPGVHPFRDGGPWALVHDRMDSVMVEGHRPTDHDAALIALLERMRVTATVLPLRDDEVLLERAALLASRSSAMRTLFPRSAPEEELTAGEALAGDLAEGVFRAVLPRLGRLLALPFRLLD